MKKPVVRKLRCAVYTRKSSEEGLEQEFNSLDAQREACEAYIASQKTEGWLLVPDHYDDGGISGATLERPALQRLLADIEAHRVEVVVVYKIDRLSRALMDFSKLVEIFDRNNVTFVSVTQSFNTTTSMGRLTLNILLSFAQFEREVIGERIRDKFAASRRKGMWMGGFVPLGYDVKDRKLVGNEVDAKKVRMIFERFIKIGSATTLVRTLRAEGVTGKYGKLVDKGYIYKLLNNRVYIGQAVHKGTAYPGEHEAIVSQALWDKVHSILTESPRHRAARTRAQTPALLKGLIFGPTGRAMTPTHTRKGGKLYRYYVSTDVLKRDADACTVRRIPAAEIESAVVDQLRGLLRVPEIIVRTWRAAKSMGDISEIEVREALERLDPLWDELFPAEQARIVQLLVERVDISVDGADTRGETVSVAAVALLLFCAHFVAYGLFAHYREFSYLRGSAIGIDIDGVLNKHREKFCEMTAAKLGKHIHPEDIKVLPVHENTNLSNQITRSDERRIFNDPDYWTSMPELDGAADAIKSIKTAFLLPVHIFTHRPWPDVRPSKDDDKTLRSRWRSAARAMAAQANARALARLWVRLATGLNHRASIKYITIYWLRSRGIAFDSLLVERGNENVVHTRGRYENRFNYARRKRIRFFVEDDWIKAIKLSYVCDVVFLMDHPYNQTVEGDPSKHAEESIIGSLPANVVRVRSWLELKKFLSQLV